MEAKRKGEDTSNLSMSTMVQLGKILVVSIGEAASQPIIDETITCPLVSLQGLTAEALFAAMLPYMPLSSSKGPPDLPAGSKSFLFLVADRATANGKLIFAEIVLRGSKYVIKVDCGAHGLHCCNGDQGKALDSDYKLPKAEKNKIPKLIPRVPQPETKTQKTRFFNPALIPR